MKSCELMLTRNDEFKCKKCWANVSIYCRGSVLLAQILQTVHNFENFPMFYNLDILITYHVLVVHLTWDLGENESMMHFLESKFSVGSTSHSVNFFIWSWFTNFQKNIMISAIFSLFLDEYMLKMSLLVLSVAALTS